MENKLQIIVKESGLDKTKSQYLLDNFTTYFEIASEWEKKAKDIVVKDENDKTEMQMARVGRLFLREKRIAIERSRVELKAEALREGKAIDGIANILKALIIPIEEYLGKQENFVKLKAEAKAEQKRLDDEKKAEKELRLKEEAEKKEQERIRLENIKLQKEVDAKEKIMRAERKKALLEREVAEAKLKAEQEASEKKQEEIRAKAEAEKAKVAELARIEKEKADKVLTDERAKAEQERLIQVELQKQLDSQIECPFCHKKFTIKK